MRRWMGVATAAVLALTIAPAALAAPVVFRDSSSFSGVASGLTAACGFEVWLEGRESVVIWGAEDGSYDIHVQTSRTYTGPGGAALVRAGYSFGADVPAEESYDEATNTLTLVFRETTRGERTVVDLGGGKVYQEAGWFYATLTIVDDGVQPVLTFEDVEAHGHPNMFSGPATDLLCSLLA